MNKSIEKQFKPLSDSELKNLCQQTQETIAVKNQMRKFTVVDLWRIQRNFKSAKIRSTVGF